MLRFNRIKVTTRTANLLGNLRNKTGLNPNILSRFAICLSLKDPSIPNPDEFNEKGSEFHPSVLFGEYEKFFLALMIQRLHKDNLAPELYLQRHLRAHLNRGVIALWPRLRDLSDFYEMVKVERKR